MACDRSLTSTKLRRSELVAVDRRTEYMSLSSCISSLCPSISQAAKTEWSQTLWVDLNIQLLQDGVESFIKSLRKLPKDVRALPVAFFLEGRMKEFKESLPLLLDLKNEALRDRLVSGSAPEPLWSKLKNEMP